MFQVPGIPGGSDFQPPYFPPPFPQQGVEMLSPVQVTFMQNPLDHSVWQGQHGISCDPYSSSLHSMHALPQANFFQGFGCNPIRRNEYNRWTKSQHQPS